MREMWEMRAPRLGRGMPGPVGQLAPSDPPASGVEGHRPQAPAALGMSHLHPNWGP